MPTHDIPRWTPRHDAGGRSFTPGYSAGSWKEALKRKKRRRGKDPDGGGVPVAPDAPRTLEGGAAAALDFES